MAGRVGNASILATATATYQGLSTLDITDCCITTSPTIGCPTSTSSHTLALVATTFPHSHNVGVSQNTQARSTPDAIKSLAENDGDPNIEVTIRDTKLDDTSVSTTQHVDAVGPTIGSIGGVGTMEGILTTLENKND
jgi:hypothetical protein